MAVKGTADKHGVFTVSSVLYAPPAPQAQLSLPRELPSGTSGRYVALVSGLHLGGGGGNPLPAQLLVDHLCGLLGSSPVRAFPPVTAHCDCNCDRDGDCDCDCDCRTSS